jgi:hypothetical protein
MVAPVLKAAVAIYQEGHIAITTLTPSPALAQSPAPELFITRYNPAGTSTNTGLTRAKAALNQHHFYKR